MATNTLRDRSRILIPAGLAILVLTAAFPCAAQVGLPPQFVVETADDWTALFDRTSGWTGADGIYSIPLKGDDRFGAADGQQTFFLFSDTFIGEVDDTGQRTDTVLINNTGALLRGGAPDPDAIEFLYRTGDSGAPSSLVVPRTPETQPDEYYWMGDGVAIEGTLHVFGLRMAPGGAAGFVTRGVNLISMPLGDRPQEPAQIDTPLFLPDDGMRGDVIFGAGILDNTTAAGSPYADGYIYVYGTQNDPYVKKLVAARVRPETFLDFTTWEYYGDAGWSGDVTDLAELTTRVSNELSVTPMPDGSGRWVLVFQEDAIGRYVSLRVGESPIGPWSRIHRIYEVPEIQLDPDIFTYNAKAHPHISRPGELLISYNVNTFDFWDHFRYADIYRPRFIRIRVDDGTPLREGAPGEGGPVLAAAPNPFNPRTEVSFRLDEAQPVTVAVYDVAGRMVKSLADGAFPAGAHTLTWDGRDHAGRSCPAGIYFCRLRTATAQSSTALSLVK
ncbi:MAG: DUF5005 domain-containing protein [bacterium]